MAGIEKQIKKAVKGKGTGGKKSSSKGGSTKGVEKAAKKLLKQTGQKKVHGPGPRGPGFFVPAASLRRATKNGPRPL